MSLTVPATRRAHSRSIITPYASPASGTHESEKEKTKRRQSVKRARPRSEEIQPLPELPFDINLKDLHSKKFKNLLEAVQWVARLHEKQMSNNTKLYQETLQAIQKKHRRVQKQPRYHAGYFDMLVEQQRSTVLQKELELQSFHQFKLNTEISTIQAELSAPRRMSSKNLNATPQEQLLDLLRDIANDSHTKTARGKIRVAQKELEHRENLKKAKSELNKLQQDNITALVTDVRSTIAAAGTQVEIKRPNQQQQQQHQINEKEEKNKEKNVNLKKLEKVLTDTQGDVHDHIHTFIRRVKELHKQQKLYPWQTDSDKSPTAEYSEDDDLLMSLPDFIDNIFNHVNENYNKTSFNDSPLDSEAQLVPEHDLLLLVENQVYSRIYKYTLERVDSQEEDEHFFDMMTEWKDLTQDNLHINNLYQTEDLVPYFDAIAKLRQLPLAESPTRKLATIKAAAHTVFAIMEKRLQQLRPGKETVVGGDDFVPVWIYVTLKSALRHIATEFSFISSYMHHTLRGGESAYYFTTFELAMEYIRNLQQDQLKITEHPLLSPTAPREQFNIICPQISKYLRWVRNDPRHLEVIVPFGTVRGFKLYAVEEWLFQAHRFHCCVAVPTDVNMLSPPEMTEIPSSPKTGKSPTSSGSPTSPNLSRISPSQYSHTTSTDTVNVCVIGPSIQTTELQRLYLRNNFVVTGIPALTPVKTEVEEDGTLAHLGTLQAATDLKEFARANNTLPQLTFAPDALAKQKTEYEKETQEGCVGRTFQQHSTKVSDASLTLHEVPNGDFDSYYVHLCSSCSLKHLGCTAAFDDVNTLTLNSNVDEIIRKYYGLYYDEENRSSIAEWFFFNPGTSNDGDTSGQTGQAGASTSHLNKSSTANPAASFLSATGVLDMFANDTRSLDQGEWDTRDDTTTFRLVYDLITEIQRMLSMLSFTPSLSAKASGVYDDVTRNAVQLFKQAYNDTQGFNVPLLKTTFQRLGLNCQLGLAEIQLMKDYTVSLVQLLSSLGFRTPKNPPTFQDLSLTVQDFQVSCGLFPDGRLGAKTVEYLTKMSDVTIKKMATSSSTPSSTVTSVGSTNH